MMHKEISIEVLTEKLSHGEESGLISSQIVNRNDEPMAAWKTNFNEPKQTKPKLRPTDLLRRRLHTLKGKHLFALSRRDP
jgi:hypothetical protein